jgi:hypothetical protein
MSRALVLAVALSLSLGCDLVKMNWGSECSFTIDRSHTSVGMAIDVTFETLNQEDGRRYWIAIQREDTPITSQAGRIPVPEGARTMKLFARTPGACEVRVYTESKGEPNRVVARRKLRVEP